MEHLTIKLKRTGLMLAAAGLILVGSGSVALATSTSNAQANGGQEFRAVLNSVNASKATGLATASVDSNGIGHFRIVVKNLINAPHAQHVHFGVTAAHECPSPSADANNDGVVDTTEGGPSYGPVQTSLTTTGDTSPSSTLAVTRYPTYANGAEYDRTFQLTADQAQQIRSGQSIVVVHGIDTLTPDGKYDGTAVSELDASLPQEATAPAVCGPLHEVTTSTSSTVNNTTGSATNSGTKTMDYVAIALGGVALIVALAGFSSSRKA